MTVNRIGRHPGSISDGEASVGRSQRTKRLLLAMTFIGQAVGSIILMEARYEGQGLTPVFFRLSTMDDRCSLAFSGLALVLIAFTFFRPKRMSRARVICLTALVGILLWLDIGLRHTLAEDFSSEAAVALLIGMVLLLALLLTGSHFYDSSIRTCLRIVRNGFVFSIFFMLIAFFDGFFYPTYSRIEEVTAFNADAGVILGAAVWHGRGLGERPSPALKERIDLGRQLLEGQAVPRLIVTGGSAPGELAEADIAKRELLKKGIDPDQIIEENISHSTLEQVQFLRQELFLHQGWSRFAIVSDQYHLARVCDMCKFNGLTVIGCPSPIHEPFLDLAYYRIRESVALIEYWMLGR